MKAEREVSGTKISNEVDKYKSGAEKCRNEADKYMNEAEKFKSKLDR